MNSPYESLSERRAHDAPTGERIPGPPGGTAWQPGAPADAGYAASGTPRPSPYAGNLVQTPAGRAGAWVRSTPGKRLGAYLLEGLLLVVTLGIGWIIWSLIVWSQGQTPAKSVLGMRCVTESGRPATWGTMFMREIVGKGLLGGATCGLTTLVSCFMILGETRQGVWDRVAATHVVDDPR